MEIHMLIKNKTGNWTVFLQRFAGHYFDTYANCHVWAAWNLGCEEKACYNCQLMIAEELESLKQTWRLMVCMIVQFLHPHRTLHSLFINSCFTLVSWGGTDSAEPMPDTGYKQNELWHQPSQEQNNPLPFSTLFHMHYSAPSTTSTSWSCCRELATEDLVRCNCPPTPQKKRNEWPVPL